MIEEVSQFINTTPRRAKGGPTVTSFQNTSADGENSCRFERLYLETTPTQDGYSELENSATLTDCSKLQ